ncbi:MAG: DUF1700 domain-containing protein [Mollicutes bacterium]|nr:DUF1700 domain-containing protein [Mollicutes bacterium]
MNKKKFLEELEKRLIILDETEKQDILNEYKDIINEKVKHGKTEEEAIADFGSIDELVKEILGAYKINPDYLKNKQTNSEKAKEIINNSEDLIKTGAKKLADFTRNIINDIKQSDITVETIFEIIIKAVLLLFGFVILRIPFWIIEGLGLEILDMIFYPFDKILVFIWSVIIGVLYLTTCIIIAFLVFKRYFYSNSKPKDNISEIKKEKINIKDQVEKKQNKNNNNSTIMIILKVILVCFFLIPLFLSNFGLTIALVVLGFLLYKGLNVISLIIVLLGLITIFGCIGSFINNILRNRIKFNFISLIIGIALFVTGCLLVVDSAIKIDYYNDIPHYSYVPKTIVYNEEIDEKTYIYGNDEIEIVIDNTLEDGKIDIEVTYYDDFIAINKRNHTEKRNDDIYITTRLRNNSIGKLLDIMVAKLKENKIYNYGYFFKPEIRVFANEKTINLIKEG